MSTPNGEIKGFFYIEDFMCLTRIFILLHGLSKFNKNQLLFTLVEWSTRWFDNLLSVSKSFDLLPYLYLLRFKKTKVVYLQTRTKIFLRK